MKKNLMAFGLCTIVLGLMDFLWLSFATPRYYSPLMGELLRRDVQMVPAIAFYLIFAFGLAHFAVSENVGASSKKIAFDGGLVGLIGYGTYNLSALAVIKGWSLSLTIIDMVWGVSVSAFTALLTSLILKHFSKGA